MKPRPFAMRYCDDRDADSDEEWPPITEAKPPLKPVPVEEDAASEVDSSEWPGSVSDDGSASDVDDSERRVREPDVDAEGFIFVKKSKAFLFRKHPPCLVMCRRSRLRHFLHPQPPKPSDTLGHAHGPWHPPYLVCDWWDRWCRSSHELGHEDARDKAKTAQRRAGIATGVSPGEVPRDLRELGKRNSSIKFWVQELEKPMRELALRVTHDYTIDGHYLEGFEPVEHRWKQCAGGSKDLGMVCERYSNVRRYMTFIDVLLSTNWPAPEDTRIVYDAISGEKNAFKRWIVHVLANYYGFFKSESITLDTGDKIVEVAAETMHPHERIPDRIYMPPPLWTQL